MNNESNIQPQVIVEKKQSIWLPVLGAGVLAAGMFTVYQGSQTTDLRKQVAAYKQENDAIRGKLLATDAQLETTLSSLRDEVSSTRQEAQTTVARAKTEASRHADLLVKRVEKKQELQAQQAKQLGVELNAEIGKVKESTVATESKIEGINSEIGSVKSEVASAKSGIDETNTALSRVRGDMGVMSGLVATNSKEIQYLRELGDRNIYEFTITKNQGLQKVGNIQVQLRKSDLKKNRYTVDVLSDDKRVEKRDKGVNEPVQFYTSSARQPFEIVVNEVSKDKIKGYLATPKVSVARN